MSAGLQQVAHAQVDALFDVAAILRTAVASIAAGDTLDEQRTGDIRRVMEAANERVAAVVGALTPHI